VFSIFGNAKRIPASEFDRLVASAARQIEKFKETVARCNRVADEYGMVAPQALRAIALQIGPFFSLSGVEELDALLDLKGRLYTQFELIDTRVREWKENAIAASANGNPEGFRRLEEEIYRGEALLESLRKKHTE